MIQFQNVTKKYSHNEFVIEDLSFFIEPGEFVFLIGPSGAGKTSVIRMLIREEKPSQGKIYFDDFDITKLSRNSIYKLRRQMGVVFQDYKLIPDKTIYENVAFPMEVAGRHNKDIRETVPYLLDIVGLSARHDAFPAQLSGGEKQRVAIARAVANNPRVLIADEPTGNLDPASAWDIVQILTKINNWGTTVIMSTHGTDIVNALHKRVIQMQGGKIIRDDRSGQYELTADFETGMLGEELQLEMDPVKASELEQIIPEHRKSTIKVKLNTESTQPKQKKGFFGFLGWGNSQGEQGKSELKVEPNKKPAQKDSPDNIDLISKSGADQPQETVESIEPTEPDTKVDHLISAPEEKPESNEAGMKLEIPETQHSETYQDKQEGKEDSKQTKTKLPKPAKAEETSKAKHVKLTIKPKKHD